ncbi:MAG: adenosine deaminase [Anaerolineales bacterium]|nr:adenosine deaminase [Anaerolineales bacterium]
MGIQIKDFIEQMPKVELHVHLEGSVVPETLLILAQKNNIALPANNLDELREWYIFKDFDHFIEIYSIIAGCFRHADDIELIAREFLIGQAKQNILYSEVTFTPYSQFAASGLGFHEQMDAVERARLWANEELGVDLGIIVDIPRMIPAKEGDVVADWVIERYGDGLLIALGLGGPEIGNPPEKFKTAFDKVRAKGIPCILHAGETMGPESIWQAFLFADSLRIGHGVRAIEDPNLVEHLREKQIPLEVCPTSNICLKVYPSLEEHSLTQLLNEDLFITINSDDPPMFNTTLTNEFLQLQGLHHWDMNLIEKLTFNALNASLLSLEQKQALTNKIQNQFKQLRSQLSV